MSLAPPETLLLSSDAFIQAPPQTVTGDSKQAFLTALEKNHGRQLRRYLAARVRNAAAEVPDLAQEVYLRLLRIDHHETIRDTPAYLYTVASHVLHQFLLRRAAVSRTIDIMDVACELENALGTDPARQVELEQRFEQLGRGLYQHSPRAYTTLILHRCEGLSLQDIAPRLGVSYTMVKRYLSKALTYCEQHFDDTE